VDGQNTGRDQKPVEKVDVLRDHRTLDLVKADLAKKVLVKADNEVSMSIVRDLLVAKVDQTAIVGLKEIAAPLNPKAKADRSDVKLL
jgi:hypothetical protein